MVVPSAGPPCFLDPELFGLNVITGDEMSIFPDATAFVDRLEEEGIDTGRIVIPGIRRDHRRRSRRRRPPDARRRGRADLHRQEGLPGGLRRRLAAVAGGRARDLARHRRPTCWPPCEAWWEPLLASAPTLRAAVGAAAPPPPRGRRASTCWSTSRRGGAGVDRRALRVLLRPSTAASWRRSWPLGPSTGRTRSSCRAASGPGAPGEFNEFLYNFFKSLSPERMARAEAEARAKRGRLGGEIDPDSEVEEVRLGHVDRGALLPPPAGRPGHLRPGRRLRADLRAPRLAVRPGDRALPHRRRPLHQGPSGARRAGRRVIR